MCASQCNLAGGAQSARRAGGRRGGPWERCGGRGAAAGRAHQSLVRSPRCPARCVPQAAEEKKDVQCPHPAFNDPGTANGGQPLCAANQCCPRSAQTNGLTYPCPASPRFQGCELKPVLLQATSPPAGAAAAGEQAAGRRPTCEECLWLPAWTGRSRVRHGRPPSGFSWAAPGRARLGGPGAATLGRAWPLGLGAVGPGGWRHALRCGW